MTSRSTNGDVRLERLRAEYKSAFEQWALQVNRLHAGQSAPGSLAAREAEEQAEAAEILYRSNRNRLARNMLTASPDACRPISTPE